jgi:STAS-like domain of unknown function (DUF4325)
MVIRLRSIVRGANTFDEGVRAFDALQNALKKPGKVVVSFDGIQTATSSFVNASFVGLLDQFSYADLKSRVRVVDSTRQINEMIKTRMERTALAAA